MENKVKDTENENENEIKDTENENENEIKDTENEVKDKLERDIRYALSPKNELKIREACEEFDGEYIGKFVRPSYRFVIKATPDNIEK
jgi:hypothetical protein